MPDYMEENVAGALFDIIDNGLTLGESLEKHNVPKTTLYCRINGSAARNETI